MGHIRTGRLPKTRRWQQVVGLLSGEPERVDDIAAATAEAATRRLRELGEDPALGYTLWLLARIAGAADGPFFADELRTLGVYLGEDETALSFIRGIGDHLRQQFARMPRPSADRELALAAARRALTETVGAHPDSLFGASLADVQHAARAAAGPQGFGLLARRFFGEYFARTLRSYVEREVANQTSADQALSSAAEARSFSEAMDLYARQSARILEGYAPDWYRLHRYQSAGQISQGEAAAFTKVAMRKLRSELAAEYR